MKTTLYSFMKPLISGTKTGIITVVSEYGPEGKLYLKNGCIVDAATGNLTGRAAASELAKWVSISTEYTAKIETDIQNPDTFDHMGFVKLLACMDKIVHVIKKNHTRK